MKPWLAYPCRTDLVVFLISKSDPQINILPAQSRCPICRSLLLVCEEYPDEFKTNVMKAVEFFQATNGLGLPDEQDASKIRVEHAVLGGFIRGIVLEEVAPKRTIITSIDIQGIDKIWRKLHFASSTKGATIFRIETM